MELKKHQATTSSLYDLSRQTLTVSLLKIRTTSVSSRENSVLEKVPTFLFPELVERVKTCKGIEVIHLISALPHSGLRPDLLKVLETYQPMISPFLEKYWKEVCSSEFPRVSPDPNESWLDFYYRQVDSSKSKILAAGSRLRDSYRGEERKVHQLQTISAAPLKKRTKPFSLTQSGTKKTSLMEKSRQEALNSSTRSNNSPNKSVVTFRMRQPSQKR